MTKLISGPSQVGINAADVRANPGSIVDVRDDVLRELMKTPHAIERPTLSERGDAEHPRRRVCV